MSEYRDKDRRAYYAKKPIISLVLPSQADLAELRTVALGSSTSVSEFVRQAVRKAIDEEQAKTA